MTLINERWEVPVNELVDVWKQANEDVTTMLSPSRLGSSSLDTKSTQTKSTPSGSDAKSTQVKSTQTKSTPSGSDAKSTQVKSTPSGSDTKSTQAKSTPVTCPYIFSRGKSKGEVCGRRVLIAGRAYCGRHKQHEGKMIHAPEAKAPEAKAPEAKAPEAKAPECKTKQVLLPGDTTPIEVEMVPPSDPYYRFCRMNTRIGWYWHQKTRVVFRDKDDRVAIAKAMGYDMVPLEREDLINCERWGIPYDLTDESWRPLVPPDPAPVEQKHSISMVKQKGRRQHTWTGTVTDGKYTVTEKSTAGTRSVGKAVTSTNAKISHPAAMLQMEDDVKEQMMRGYTLHPESKTQTDQDVGSNASACELAEIMEQRWSTLTPTFKEDPTNAWPFREFCKIELSERKRIRDEILANIKKLRKERYVHPDDM